MSLFTPFQQFFDENGSPLAGGTLDFFTQGTTSVRQDTFSDSSLLIPNANPVVLDGEGRLPNIIFGLGVYNVFLKSKEGVLINQLDPVGGAGSAIAFPDWVSTTLYDIFSIVTGTDGRFYQSIGSSNLDNDPVLNPGANEFWKEIRFIAMFNTEVTYDQGEIVQTPDGFLWYSVIPANINNNPTGDDGSNWLPAVNGAKIPELIGRNTVIDGRFDFWFEDVTQSSSGYGSDTMWFNENVGSAKVNTQETLILGVDVPDVPTAEFYSRTVVTSVAGASNLVRKLQNIEDVSTLAGKSVVVSFYARTDSAKDIAVNITQNFGTGGSPSADVELAGKKVTLSTSFQRFELEFQLPSLTGKTKGTGGDSFVELSFWFDAGTDFDSLTDTLGQQSGTFELAAIQLEEGVQATDFVEEGQQESRSRVDRYFQFGEFYLATVNSDNSERRFWAPRGTTMAQVPVESGTVVSGVLSLTGTAGNVQISVTGSALAVGLLMSDYIADARL